MLTDQTTTSSKGPLFSISGNKVFFISLGCPRNLVDTEVMIGILLEHGYESCDTLELADVIVINTCGFLEAARQESCDTINSVLQQKKSSAKVIATGCMVQSYRETLEQSCPGLHYLLGSGDVEGILKAVIEEEKGALVTTNRSYLEVGEVPRTLSTPQHYAYLKIAEGCRKRCSYCIIPDIKGPLKSKPIERILKELYALINKGVREIIFIAQDLGDWGRDLGYQGSAGLLHLLQQLLQDESVAKSSARFRLLYVYPDEITDEFVSFMKQHQDKIIPYLDMPIQHANNDILKAMRRTTSKEEILRCVKTLRKEIPNITIRTSIIVGFPGETEEHFRELCDFIKEIEIENVGIFTYSKEEKSHSASLPHHLPEDVKEARQKKLSKIQKKIAISSNTKRYLEKTISVTVDGYHPETKLLMVGRHEGQCPDIDGIVLINDGRLVDGFGKRYLVEITEISEYDLVGRVVRHDSKENPAATQATPNKRLRIV